MSATINAVRSSSQITSAEHPIVASRAENFESSKEMAAENHIRLRT